METKCYLLSSIYFIFPTLILLYTFITAFIRYKRVLTAMNNENWKTEAELIRSTNRILLATFFVLFLTFLIGTQFDFGMIGYLDQCLANATGNVSNGSFLIFTVRHIIVLCTIYFDLKCFRLVRSYRNQISESIFQFSQHEHRHILYEIPMRATIINGIYLLMTVIMAPIIITYGEEFKIASVLILISLLIKTPLMVMLTFRVNATTTRVDKEEERERKRQVEIEEAKQKQADRLAKRTNNEVATAQVFPVLPNVIHVAEVPDSVCHF